MAGRFASNGDKALIARGIAALIGTFLVGSFCWSLFSLARPLIMKTVPADGQMNGLMLVFAPALAGVLCALYALVASLAMRGLHWMSGGGAS